MKQPVDLFLFNKVTSNYEGVRFKQNPQDINYNKYLTMQFGKIIFGVM